MIARLALMAVTCLLLSTGVGLVVNGHYAIGGATLGLCVTSIGWTVDCAIAQARAAAARKAYTDALKYHSSGRTA